jgi:hypothetical protein
MREKRLLAPFKSEGACNREVFQTWMREYLLPQLQEGDIISLIMPVSTQEKVSKNWW